ncbi:MAG: GFA family protein [Boseongicola sp.]|nr:MAG: GFA family protein [Boseongicola sp.]
MKGQCLCGSVQYETSGEVRSVSACHCEQCRRQSGHVWSSAQTSMQDIVIEGDVRWFEASSKAKRGFCAICGSFLFWKAQEEDFMSFSLGSVSGATGSRLEKHIFTGEKGDYYEISDGVDQF